MKRLDHGTQIGTETDTEMLIERIEREVKSNPILIGGRIMTTEGKDDEIGAGPSSSLAVPPSTPKLDFQYFDENMCYAPPEGLKRPKSNCARPYFLFWSLRRPHPNTKGGPFWTPRCLIQ